jgi:hypothetical protein
MSPVRYPSASAIRPDGLAPHPLRRPAWLPARRASCATFLSAEYSRLWLFPARLSGVPFTSGLQSWRNQILHFAERRGRDLHREHPLRRCSGDIRRGRHRRGRRCARCAPKVAGEYYEAGVFPAYGIYARRVRGLSLSNVRFDVAAPELRPAIVFDHVMDAAVNGLSAQGNPQSESLLRLIETRDVLLTASRVLTPSAVFLQVEGAGSKASLWTAGIYRRPTSRWRSAQAPPKIP